MFGLANNANLSWMQTSGATWDARYQYLSGGVNTGTGWETFNSPSGAFASLFMDASRNANLIPVFTYDELLQSKPATGADESAKIRSNLQNTGTMNAYYSNWKLLMDKCATFGDPVIISVEPDAWGYVEQTVDSGTNSAATVPASVSSSGNVEAAGLPDTVQGFALALLRMRDKYAPNAILAIHTSYWGTNANWSSGSTIDVAALAARSSAFTLTCGISGNPGGIKPWDLIFAEIHDRDDGFYTVAMGQTGYYWTSSDYDRYRDYLSRINLAVGRRLIIWQVPCGNTIYRTCNDTTGHYQSNEAQTFLENYPANPRIASYAGAGVIGILFGATISQTTSYDDAKGDGITNPTPVAGNSGTTATVSDDDGGYLRSRVANYGTKGRLQLP